MTRWIFILLLTVCVSDLSRAQAENDLSVLSKLTALERTVRVQAWQAKDIRTLNAALDDDFVYVDEQGTVMSKMQFVSSIQSSNPIHCAVDLITAKLHGNTAVVTGLYQISSAVKGKALIKRGRFLDIWLKKSGVWLAVSSISIPEQQ